MEFSYLVVLTTFVLLLAQVKAGSNYVESTDVCGEVLDGLAGAINYKVGRPTDPREENCVWTIRTELKSMIELQLIEDGFNYTWAPVIKITRLGRNDAYLPVNTLELKKGDRNIYNVSGPLIFVQFATRRDVLQPGTGFTLTFKGVGQNVPGPIANTNDTYTYNLSQHDEPNGLVRYPEIPGTTYPSYEFFTLTLQPNKGKHLSVTILAPIKIGYFYPQNGYLHGCNSHTSLLTIAEYDYWAGTSLRYTTCRSDRNNNATIVSPFPLVVSFYTNHVPNDGFQIKWENIDL